MLKRILKILFFLLTACRPDRTEEKNWSVEFTGIGIHSSPRVADLNGDGVMDVIIGCGKREFEFTEIGIMSVDGASGEVLWKVPARDQIFGSAALLDINMDGVVDVIIGGRSAQLLAINGRTGEIIWEFYTEADKINPREMDYYNFYNPQIIPDQNNDGISDILISNGGDNLVPSGVPDRPPGQLMIIDGSNGEILSNAYMPDQREIYMSVVIAKMHPEDEDHTIIFGTGGETIGGSLFRAHLKDLWNEDLSPATKLHTSDDKGYIAPPVLVDLNLDGTFDIVVNAVEGRILAFDGKTNELLWENVFEDMEAYASLAVGFFNADSIPDIFTTFTEGIWPQLDRSKQIMVNGKTGEIEFLDTLGILQITSPVIADFNVDGFDDALAWINFVDKEMEIFETYYSMLVVYDFHRNSSYQLTEFFPGVNLSSTPWIGDLDNDGNLDVVFCYLTNPKDETAMDGFKIVRMSLDIELKKSIKWGSYMGSYLDGIFRK